MATTKVAMSLEEYLARKETDRAEWVDGQLILMPPPTPLHALTAGNVRAVLDRARPSGFYAVEAVGWQVRPNAVRIPDVLVIPSSALDLQQLIDPPLLAVEVLSPHESPADKLGEYGAAGLAHYWTIEPHATGVLTVYENVRGTLEVVNRSAWGQRVQLFEPFEVGFEMSEILPRRPPQGPT